MSGRMAFLSLAAGLAVVASSAWAAVPMGPAMPILEKGQWAVGVEYAYGDADLTSKGTGVDIYDGFSTSEREKLTLSGMKTNMFFGRIEYALCKDWDVFIRLGAANADAGISGRDADLDGGFGFSGGLGTRATLYRSGPWQIDGLAQVTWVNPDDGRFKSGSADDYYVGTAKLDYLHSQFALAAVYRTETWGLWAGPFFQMIDGDLDLDARQVVGEEMGRITHSGDVEEKSCFGLSLGADCELGPNLVGWLEGQLTGDSWMIGVGVLIRPGQLLGDW